MDDLTLERLRTIPSVEELTRRIAARERLQQEWLDRAHSWALQRAGGNVAEVVVQYPDDADEIVALGVPCLECITLVYNNGERGHTIRFGAVNGAHWAQFISAHCGGQPA